MFLLFLLTCTAIKAAQAKVVTKFDECKDFFYNDNPPQVMEMDTVKICQKMENKPFSFASLYSLHHKIPLYSAYTLNPLQFQNMKKRKRPTANKGKNVKKKEERTSYDKWHIEPQVTLLYYATKY